MHRRCPFHGLVHPVWTRIECCDMGRVIRADTVVRPYEVAGIGARGGWDFV